MGIDLDIVAYKYFGGVDLFFLKKKESSNNSYCSKVTSNHIPYGYKERSL